MANPNEPKPTKSSDGDSVAQEHIFRQQTLESEISTWRTEWQCISDYIMPRKSQIDEKRTPGVDDFTQRIYNTEAMEAARILASGTLDFTMSGIFFQNLSPDPNADEEAQTWYRRSGEIMLEKIAESNLFNAAHEGIHARGVFGLGHLHIEEDDQRVFYAITEDVGTFTIDVNFRGEVDTVYVKKELTAKQFVDEFGIDNVGDAIRESYNQPAGKGKNKKFEYIHAIEPRSNADRIPGRLDGKNKPVKSVHIDVTGQKVLREGGYDEMPTMITRFLMWNMFEKYGYGPGFEVLPDTRNANTITKTLLAVGERQTKPPVQIPDDQEGDIDIRPAGRTIVNAKNPTAWPREWMQNARYDIGKDVLETVVDRIRRGFFVNFFQLLTNSAEIRREKTAFEVAQMLAEQVRNFSPTFSLMKEDFLNPMLARIFSICLRKGLFGTPPASVLKPTADGSFEVPVPKVNHVSKVAMLIKSVQNENWMQFLTMAQPIIDMAPDEFMKRFNLGRALDEMADNQGVPDAFRNTPEERKEIEAQMEAQAAQEQALATAETASNVAKNLSGVEGASLESLAAAA